MRSSSNYLAANRSEARIGKLVSEPFSGSYTSYRSGRREGADDHTGLHVEISVSYKTLLILFALFSVLSRLLNLILDTVVN